MINNIPKRHFYNNIDYVLDYDNKVVKLTEDFHKKLKEKKLWNKFGFKKIGGSSVGDVLQVDSFKSQFGAFCRMCWIGLPVLDRKYVDAGIAIEPKVVDALEQVLKTKVTTFPPEEYDFDYFSDKDDIIGGIPDGYIERDKIIIEIKTTGLKNYESWNKFGIPNGYLKQAQIYTYLMGVDKFWIVATFLNDQDYEDPTNYPIKDRIVKNYKYVLNKEQVLDDIENIKKWYKHYTSTGISPTWNDINDKDLLDYLECSNEQEYIDLLEIWKNEGKFIDK